jgi:hypothetical protein
MQGSGQKERGGGERAYLKKSGVFWQALGRKEEQAKGISKNGV